MRDDISLPMLAVVGVSSAILLYGIYIPIFFVCIFVLTKRRHRGSPIHWVVMGTTVLQFLLSTAYIAVELRMLIESVALGHTSTAYITAYWVDSSKGLEVTSRLIYISNTIIGDCILVWRLYVVWGRNIYICLLPMLLLLATAVCGYVTSGFLAHISTASVFGVRAIAIPMWTFSIATQALSTTLISWRIWKIGQGARSEANRRADPKYVKAISIIIESGSLYSATTTCLVIMYALNLRSSGILVDCLAQMSAIVPALIVVRVGLGLSLGTPVNTRASTLAIIHNRTPVLTTVDLETEPDSVQEKSPNIGFTSRNELIRE